MTKAIVQTENVVAIKDNKHSQANALMSIIENMATNKALDDSALDRIDRLFDKHKELVAWQAEQEYAEAMARAQGAMRPVFRNKMNGHTRTPYADLCAIHESAKPIWTREGFSVSSKVYNVEATGCVGVMTVIRHSGGHKEVVDAVWPLDVAGAQGKTNKTAIQGMGSSL